MLIYFVFQAVKSIGTVFKSITITERGLGLNNILRLGKTQFYNWNELSAVNVNTISGGRSITYKNLTVEKDGVLIVTLDELTYRNFYQMKNAIELNFNKHQD